MNNPLSLQERIRPVRKAATLGLLGALGLWLATSDSSAQTTNAYDVAADAAYAGAAAPNGLAPGGQNGGFGFGAWTFNVPSTGGGAFIAGSGPSGASFDLWNTGGNASTVAVRPFSSPLSPGQSFSVQLQLNSLDGTSNTNALALQDASGNTLFSYYHVGGDNLDGHYTDATTSNGKAPNFRYDYQQFVSFTFTLNSATTYVFTDNKTGASISGSIAGGPIAQVAFVRANGNATGNGQDFQFDGLTITSSGQVAPPAFQQQTPAPGAFSALTNTPVTVQVVPGGVPLKTGSVVLRVDGTQVDPTVTSAQSILTVSYQPSVAFGAGTKHTAQVVVTDNNNTAYTNTWSFTIGFSSLPVVLSGPIAVSNGNEVVIATATGEGWLGTNYNASSSRTLYSRFSMVFHDLNGETGNGGGYGGLHFFRDNDARLLVGNGWTSLAWSLDAAGNQVDLSPWIPVALDEWHTLVVRTDYAPGANATVTVWLDPDFTQTEAYQPNFPLTLTADAAFNNIRLRCGNGTASAEFTNIVLAATGPGVGFAVPADPQFQGFVPAMNAASAAPSTVVKVDVVVGGVSIPTKNITMTLDGVAVKPVCSVSGNIITVAYQPAVPFEPSSSHYVNVNLTDANGASFVTGWNFTVDTYPRLPITLAGPYDVSGGGAGITLFNNQNGWIDSNYGADSTNTLYTRFSMVFNDLGGETGSGGGFGGLQFFQGNSEGVIVGNNWGSLNWGYDAFGNQQDLVPAFPVTLGEWHTLVVKQQLAPGASARFSIWLDPDFTKTEGNQPQAPTTFSATGVFDNVRLRCGNGSASAQFTNIVMAATSTGVGFVAPPAPAQLTIQHSGANITLSWTSTGKLQEATALNGSWKDSADQSNPQTRPTSSAPMFFRLLQ